MWQWFSRLFVSRTPTATELGRLFSQIDDLLPQVQAEESVCTRDVIQKRDALKQELNVQNNVVAEARWQGLPEADKSRIANAVQSLLKKLVGRSVLCGWGVFLILSVVFVAIVIWYSYLHKDQAKPAAVRDDRISKIAEALREVELRVEALKRAKAEIALVDKTTQATSPPADADPGATTSSKALAEAKATAIRGELTSSVAKLRENLKGLDFGITTQRLVGEISGEAAQDAITETPTLANLGTSLRADLETLHTAFFWRDPAGRWKEIAFWSEMGVLVGILFYIAAQLAQRMFLVSDIPTYIVEMLIAPVVTMAIFFLFEFAGIKEITAGAASSATTVGLAFILGFAIRRTVGLLNTIKRRLLPEPVEPVAGST